ncbi:MAG: exodeoxyribonuclease VII small subunit [Gemmatimonadota bacterium]
MSKSAGKSRAKEEPASFEAAMEILEDSVSRLESGDLTLEDSLEVFERGIAASRTCAHLLDQTRQRVQVLVDKAGGDFQLEFLDQELGDAGEEAESGT